MSVLPRTRGQELLPYLAATMCGLMLVTGAHAQAKPEPSDVSKFDLYGGYGFWDPIDSDIYGRYYPKVYNPNVTASGTYWFSRHFGFQVEGEYIDGPVTLDRAGNCNALPCSPRGQKVYTGEGGLAFRLPHGNFIPFAHALGGGVRINGPYNNPLIWGWGVTGGIGVDYILPFAHGLFAVRPIQADFQYEQANYGLLYLPAATNGGLGVLTITKLSAGLVMRFGGAEPARAHDELMLGCEVTPGSAYPGEPIKVTANPMNLRPKKATSTFTASGGQVTQGDMGATVDTTGLVPGEYKLNGTVSQGSRASEQARCEGTFTVKAYEPPTLTCSADPSTVVAGGVSTITAISVSPSHRTLTYSFSSDAGQINPTGSPDKVQLSTAAVSAGGSQTTVNIRCNVVDDFGNIANTSTQVAVVSEQRSAAPPPMVQTSSLCSISFDRDTRRPVRVDNEAKACLDDIALNLQRQPEAKLVIIGNYGTGESETRGAERSLNARQYLSDEKGIDPSRLDVRIGTASGRGVDDILLPPGAPLNSALGRPFDVGSIHRSGRAYGKLGQSGSRHASPKGRSKPLTGSSVPPRGN